MVMERELSVGLLVSHRTSGLGKVLLLDSEDVWIYFKDIEGTPEDAVKHLKRPVARSPNSSPRRSLALIRRTSAGRCAVRRPNRNASPQ